MKSIVARRVARGAEFMDEVRPGWFNEIDVQTLNIGSGRDCILGQIYGNYTRGCRQLGIGADFFTVVGYGFIPMEWGALVWVSFFQTIRLTRAWRREIEKRRVDAALARGWQEEEKSDTASAASV